MKNFDGFKWHDWVLLGAFYVVPILAGLWLFQTVVWWLWWLTR